MSTDHQTDPYLSCDSTAEPWQCMSQILENGSYHVGVLYENSTCGQYAFWWHGVLFSQRQLSASLVPVNEPDRHLDHRMAQVLNTPAANSRYLQTVRCRSIKAGHGRRERPSRIFADARRSENQHRLTGFAINIHTICTQTDESWWCQGSEQQSNVTLLLETTRRRYGNVC
jgi:hypothetical protein